jgi:RNA polymerase sigma-70 factor (ECF subfamily)
MTETQSPDLALYWSEALGDELLNFLAKRLKCKEIAAEITQETFLRIHQNVTTNPPNNARALAYRIAINLANDYQRKIKVRDRFVVNVEPVYLADTHPSETPGPEQIVMARQRLRQFHDSLAELPADCRMAFMMHSIDGLSYAEIADRLGISESMVFKHLSRATKHCIKRLDKIE